MLTTVPHHLVASLHRVSCHILPCHSTTPSELVTTKVVSSPHRLLTNLIGKKIVLIEISSFYVIFTSLCTLIAVLLNLKVGEHWLIIFTLPYVYFTCCPFSHSFWMDDLNFLKVKWCIHNRYTSKWLTTTWKRKIHNCMNEQMEVMLLNLLCVFQKVFSCQCTIIATLFEENALILYIWNLSCQSLGHQFLYNMLL